MIRVPPTTSRNLLSCLYSQSSSSSPSLAGTVPFHDCYVFLHTRKPPTSYPGRVKSPLQRSLQLLALQWGGIINFSWSPEQPTLAAGSISEVAEWEGGDQEAYRATAFSRFNGKLELPEVNLRNLEEINSLLSTHANPRSPPSDYHSPDPALHLYVCIHGERDCRCGDTGGKVFDALRREVTDRGLSGKVEVAGVGHVGGHKYAANLLVYPWGDWLGDLHESNVPQVFDELLSRFATPPVSPLWTLPLSPPHWRGRMGLDKEEQLVMLTRV